MGLYHRNLMSESFNGAIAEEVCPKFCVPTNTEGVCPSLCLSFCSGICRKTLISPPPPPPPPPSPSISSNEQSSKSEILSPLLIILLAALAATFVIVCVYALFVKYYASRRRSPLPEPERNEIHDEFLDEDHGPVLDHPIWYINTIGLQSSVISAITVCKYKRGEGLVEGTECSVCLNEFQEDETLRLLPKCNHAFHIPCIDTWLRSHTNCPMCRAPIVRNTARTPSSERIIDDSGTRTETQVGILENNGESNREMEERVLELRIGTEDEEELVVEDKRRRCGTPKEEMDEIQPMRRSVSLDSVSASKISLALANIVPRQSEGNLDRQLVKVNEKRVGGSQSSRRFVGSSAIGRSLQNGSTSMKRSFSSSGKFLLSRYSRSQSSALPL